MPAPLMVVLAGAPGAGKSTIALRLAERLRAVLVSVDPIEDAINRAGVASEEPVGLAAYVVAEAVAEQNLLLGHTVVVDAVNAAEEARDGWRRVGARSGASIRFVEVVCPDIREHERRLARRAQRFPTFTEPAWDHARAALERLAFWSEERLVVDTTDGDASLAATHVALEHGRRSEEGCDHDVR